MTLRQLDCAMDGNELQEWQQYAALEPWGEERMDLRFARLMAFLYNSLRGRSQPEQSAADFMPDFLADPEDTPHHESGEAAFMQLTKLSGGEVFEDDISDAEIEAYLLGDGAIQDDESDADEDE